MSDRGKAAAKLAVLALLPVCAALLGLGLGASSVELGQSVKEILTTGQAVSPDSRILLYVRLPRVCAALLAGAALAVSGMLIQAALGNPLASPNVIGVNSGAGFFTFLFMALFPGIPGIVPFGAFAGALVATLIVYAVAAGAGAGKLTIILAGVAVSTVFTAGINTVKTFFPETLYNGSTFLIGGFAGVSIKDFSAASVMILLGLPGAIALSRQADLLVLGEETARSLGQNTAVSRFLLIITACILAGAAVSFSGLLSFVGLLAPHIVRRLLGESKTGHRALLLGAALLGAGFVALCDLLSRLLFAPYEIPVGILLSFLGGPFFLFLILRQRRRGK